MFSGIIKNTALVQSLAVRAADAILRLRTTNLRLPVGIGDSISISGVCLTVSALSEPLPNTWELEFYLSSETCRRTTLGKLTAGSQVNLEQSMRLGDPVDGHFVLGHVDEIGRISQRYREGDTEVFEIEFPPALKPYICDKGSIAVDGISLTAGAVKASSFQVYLIPVTMNLTTLNQLQVGSPVNLEIDCLARYAVNAIGNSMSKKS